MTRGDCATDTADSITGMVEDPAVFETRAARIRVRQLEAFGTKTGELSSLITMLREPGVLKMCEPLDAQLIHTPPETLTDEQMLWGLGARPIENLWSEE